MRGHDEGGVATASRTVTKLAREARTFMEGPIDPKVAAELLSSIDQMAEEWKFAPEAPIHLWLNNLRRAVQRRR